MEYTPRSIGGERAATVYGLCDLHYGTEIDD